MNISNAISMAREITRDYNLRPPVSLDDVVAIMKDRNVIIELDAAMVESGRTRLTAQGVVVSLRSTDWVVRRKFTAAHELGHVLSVDFSWPSPAASEQWCDDFASEILLPGRWVRANYSAAPHDLNTLARIAHAAGISLPFAHVSAHRHLGWRTALLTFRFTRHAWRLWNTNFISKELADVITIPRGSSDVLAIPAPTPRICAIYLEIGDHRCELRTEVLGDRSTRRILLSQFDVDRLRRLLG